MLRLEVGPPATLAAGASFTLSVAVTLGELAAADVHVECQLGVVNAQGQFEVRDSLRLLPEAVSADETLYRAVVTPTLSGLAAMRLRAWPTHPLLAHRFEVGRMRWL
jgi:starch phosphorylase